MTNTINTIKNALTQKLANNTLKLPSIPEIILKINHALNDDAKSMKDIAKIIQMDASVTVRVLQIANSPALRGRVEISTVADAISRLGLNFVKDVVICASMRDGFKSTNPELNKLLQSIWECSVKLSVYGVVLCKQLKCSHINPSTMMLSGLLYYIGCLPVIDYIDSNKLEDSKRELHDAIFTLRAHIGGKILSTWELPYDIVEAISSEGIKNECGPIEYSDILFLVVQYLKCERETACECMTGADAQQQNSTIECINKFNITHEQMTQLFVSKQKEVEEMQKLLS